MAKALDAFRTISEVADDLGIHKHVLRFWEVKFSQIRPMKRGGGRRYYRPEDMELLRGIRQLLHKDGYTIKGVQKILREQGVETVKLRARPVDEDTSVEPASPSPVTAGREMTRRGGRKRGAAEAALPPASTKEFLTSIVAELTAIRAMLQSEPPSAAEAAIGTSVAKKSATQRRARRSA